MDELVADELRSLVGQRPEIVGDPRLTRALLGDVCPHSPREISLLVAAVEVGVAESLARPGGLSASHQLARLSQELVDARGLSAEAATWAVRSWAYALGMAPAPDPRPVPPGEAATSGQAPESLATSGSLASRPLDLPPQATVHGQFARTPADVDDEDSAVAHKRRVGLVAALIAVAALAMIGVVLALVVPRGLSAGPPPLGSPSASGAPPSADPSASPSEPASGSPPPGSAEGPASAGAPGPLVVVAHAGGGEKFAEETLPALLHGAKAGAAVEMDVRWTADDVAILLHGAETPTTDKASVRNAIVCDDGPHVVAETKWSVLKENCSSVAWASDDDKRYPIVTFDQALKELAEVSKGQVFIEIKDAHQSEAQDEALLDTVTKYGMVDRAVMSSYSSDALDRFEKVVSREDLFLRRMLNLPSDAGANLPDPAVLKRNGLWAVSLRSDRVTKSYFSAVRSAGLVAIAQDESPPRTGRQERELTKIWKAMKAAGATTVSTDEPVAYRRFVS